MTIDTMDKKNAFRLSALSCVALFFVSETASPYPVSVVSDLPTTAAIGAAASAAATQSAALLQALGMGFNGLTAANNTAAGQSADAIRSAINNNSAVQNTMNVNNALQPPNDACASQTVAAYANSVKQGASYKRDAISHQATVSAGNAPPAGIQIANIQNNHFNNYCDPQTDPSACKGVTPATNGSAKNEQMVGSDVQAQSLFSGAGGPGHVENLTYTPKQVTAGQVYISNLVDGGEYPRKLSQQEYQTPQGQQYEGLRLAYESKMSLARMAMNNVLADRTPITGSKQIIQDMINSDGGASASYINQRLSDPNSGISLYTQASGGDVSPAQLMDLDIGRRVNNPDWYTFINTSTDTNALLREQVLMMAQLLNIEFKKLKADELSSALAGLNAAETTKTVMLPKINAADRSVSDGLAASR